MRIVVTHESPDMDAITSIWLIRRFLSGWEKAKIQFVPAGERIGNLKSPRPRQAKRGGQISNLKNTIEKIGEDEVIHVDTGLGPLDHHQTGDDKVCAASLTLDFVKRTINNQQSTINKEKAEALNRIIKVVVDIDHFKEVFWGNPTADYHEFSLVNILDGLKLQSPNQNEFYVEFIIQCLDALLHEFENRIWAEEEIEKKGIKFNTRFGEGIGFETINDSVIKLAQKMGYVLVIRKDPRKGYMRIKGRPLSGKKEQINLTPIYEKLKKMDPSATWFLHIGRKMLLNGSVKNPKMRSTKLSLNDIIKVLEKI